MPEIGPGFQSPGGGLYQSANTEAALVSDTATPGGVLKAKGVDAPEGVLSQGVVSPGVVLGDYTGGRIHPPFRGLHGTGPILSQGEDFSTKITRVGNPPSEDEDDSEEGDAVRFDPHAKGPSINIQRLGAPDGTEVSISESGSSATIEEDLKLVADKVKEKEELESTNHIRSIRAHLRIHGRIDLTDAAQRKAACGDPPGSGTIKSFTTTLNPDYIEHEESGVKMLRRTVTYEIELKGGKILKIVKEIYTDTSGAPMPEDDMDSQYFTKLNKAKTECNRNALMFTNIVQSCFDPKAALYAKMAGKVNTLAKETTFSVGAKFDPDKKGTSLGELHITLISGKDKVMSMDIPLEKMAYHASRTANDVFFGPLLDASAKQPGRTGSIFDQSIGHLHERAAKEIHGRIFDKDRNEIHNAATRALELEKLSLDKFKQHFKVLDKAQQDQYAGYLVSRGEDLRTSLPKTEDDFYETNAFGSILEFFASSHGKGIEKGAYLKEQVGGLGRYLKRSRLARSIDAPKLGDVVKEQNKINKLDDEINKEAPDIKALMARQATTPLTDDEEQRVNAHTKKISDVAEMRDNQNYAEKKVVNRMHVFEQQCKELEKLRDQLEVIFNEKGTANKKAVDREPIEILVDAELNRVTTNLAGYKDERDSIDKKLERIMGRSPLQDIIQGTNAKYNVDTEAAAYAGEASLLAQRIGEKVAALDKEEKELDAIDPTLNRDLAASDDERKAVADHDQRFNAWKAKWLTLKDITGVEATLLQEHVGKFYPLQQKLKNEISILGQKKDFHPNPAERLDAKMQHDRLLALLFKIEDDQKKLDDLNQRVTSTKPPPRKYTAVPPPTPPTHPSGGTPSGGSSVTLTETGRGSVHTPKSGVRASAPLSHASVSISPQASPVAASQIPSPVQAAAAVASPESLRTSELQQWFNSSFVHPDEKDNPDIRGEYLQIATDVQEWLGNINPELKADNIEKDIIVESDVYDKYITKHDVASLSYQYGAAIQNPGEISSGVIFNQFQHLQNDPYKYSGCQFHDSLVSLAKPSEDAALGLDEVNITVNPNTTELYIPFFEAHRNHWTLVRVLFENIPGEGKKVNKVEYLDSYQSENQAEYYDITIPNILADLVSKLKTSVPLQVQVPFPYSHIPEDSIPQQTNGIDCGAFVCKNAQSLASSDQKINYSTADIPYQRLEILNRIRLQSEARGQSRIMGV